MASQGSSKKGSGLSITTLAIASLASLTAALIVSQFWIAGTPYAAAVMPVLVALMSEMLHRPTEAIARRVTTERTAVMPALGEAEPPPAEAPLAEQELPTGPTPPSQIRVYRPPRRRVHLKVVAITAGLAFVIAAVALTVPELIAGKSFGDGDRRLSFVPSKKSDKDEPKSETEEQQRTTPSEEQEEAPPPAEEPEETVPGEEVPPPTEEPTPTVPTVPTPVPDDQL